jgi:hypothetical protein
MHETGASESPRCKSPSNLLDTKGGDNANASVIHRTNIDIPNGQTAANRSHVELLFSGLPEPIDLDLDLSTRTIYWTDRGDPPRGNSVNRAPMDTPTGFDPSDRKDQQIIATGLNEGIGIALDVKAKRMYFTDAGGSVCGANLDGSNKRVLLTGQGRLTGIAFVILRKGHPVPTVSICSLVPPSPAHLAATRNQRDTVRRLLRICSC